MNQQVTHIVADIGGTNLRIGAISSNDVVENLTVYQCAEYSGLAEIVNHFLSTNHIYSGEINACFAIACPVDNDLISMTNLPWEFTKSALKKELGLNIMLFINDYTAIAHAVPFLTEQQKVKIGGGETIQGKPISICGPGTGLGVANVVFDEDHWISLGGEGGHVDFAPVNEQEIAILNFLLKKYEHVSYEQLLSGLGIEQIYQALVALDNKELPSLTAKDISEKALANECQYCERALAQFCNILGSFAGNLALTLASFGGVYIAGGIVPRFIEYFEQSQFRQRFEAKGRFNAFNQAIPTYVITESQPGILGASAYLKQYYLQHESKEEL